VLGIEVGEMSMENPPSETPSIP
jgi:hypothetical protein